MSLLLLFTMTQGGRLRPWGGCFWDGRANNIQICALTVEAGKKCQQRSAAAEGSWGTARPIMLLCKGSLLHNQNAESPWFPHEWSSGATWRAQSCAASKQRRQHRCSAKKIKDSLKVRSVDRWAASSRTAPGCLLTSGNQTAEVELAVTREEEHILRPLLSCLTGCITWGSNGMGEGVHDGVWRNLKAGKEGSWDYFKITSI